MMKAIKNFMNKPITWGDSFKWSGILLGLYRHHLVELEHRGRNAHRRYPAIRTRHEKRRVRGRS